MPPMIKETPRRTEKPVEEKFRLDWRESLFQP